MRFERLDDLPQHIKMILPDDVHEYYMNKYNDAYDDYQNEVIAHKIAIAAVEFTCPHGKRR